MCYFYAISVFKKRHGHLLFYLVNVWDVWHTVQRDLKAQIQVARWSPYSREFFIRAGGRQVDFGYCFFAAYVSVSVRLGGYVTRKASKYK